MNPADPRERRRLFQVLLGLRVECLLAARGTEVIGLPLVLAPELRRLFFDIHLAYRINSHSFTSLPLSSQEVYMS